MQGKLIIMNQYIIDVFITIFTLPFKSLWSVRHFFFQEMNTCIQQGHIKKSVNSFIMLLQINVVLFNFYSIVKNMYHDFYKNVFNIDHEKSFLSSKSAY